MLYVIDAFWEKKSRGQNSLQLSIINSYIGLN